MAFTQAQIDTLRESIANGGTLQSMTIDGQTFMFRSIGDQLKLLSVMERAVQGGSGTRYAATSKGL